MNLRQTATKRFAGFWFMKNRVVWMVLAEDMYQFALFGSRRLDAAFVCVLDGRKYVLKSRMFA